MTDEKQEYVYAIGHPHGYVKIGRSTDPKKRLQSHQISCPYELWVIVQLPVEDSRAIESELHEEFEDTHVRGEWFELGYDDYDMLVDMIRMLDSNIRFEDLAEFRKFRARQRKAVFQ